MCEQQTDYISAIKALFESSEQLFQVIHCVSGPRLMSLSFDFVIANITNELLLA